jgi:hypothetical protein
VPTIRCAEPHDLRSATVRLRLTLGAAFGIECAEVVGDLTAWAPVAMPFDGERFALDIEVPRGRRWHYRFRVDGSWMNDPDADDFEAWPDGGVVSVRSS